MFEEESVKPESDDDLLTVEEDEDEEEEGDGESKETNPTLPAQDDETKNITSCIRILRFLQLLCEGHHAPL